MTTVTRSPSAPPSGSAHSDEPEGGAPPRPVLTPRNAATLVMVVILAWVVVVGYVVHSAIPGPVVSLPGPDRRVVRTFLPQGWAFFTRDAREDRTRVLVRSDGAWHPEGGPNGEPRYAFGLRRYARVQMGELNELVRLTDDDAWTECVGGWSTCLEERQEVVPVANPVAAPSLCGDVGAVTYEPVPWAWAASVMPEDMPARAVRWQVSC